MKTRVIAMYLPQFHETEENNRWWGKGFTDWVSVKSSEKLFEGHRQPRTPQDEDYYDLSDVNVLKRQAASAKEHGVGGFCFYHYWFSSSLRTLTKPAELYLSHPEIDFPFMFAWDNSSWIRTWSRFKSNSNAWSPKSDRNAAQEDDGVLAKLDYGSEADWRIHFDYLLPFFSDKRYLKIGGKPVFIVWNNHQKETLHEMCRAWDRYAAEAGLCGMYFISRHDPYKDDSGFDCLFNYEPQFSGWLNISFGKRVWNKLRDMCNRTGLKRYDYDRVWKRLLKFVKKRPEMLYGCFVDYDDTPRRGRSGKVIEGGTPEKFERYFRQLYEIACTRGKEFLFLTAWNEWGEGAYLEPDTDNGAAYLQAVKRVTEES